MSNRYLKQQIQQANFAYSLQCINALTDSHEQVSYWRRYKKLHGDFVTNNNSSEILKAMSVSGFPDKKPDTSFFLLFHHGFYFTIPYWVIKKYGFKGARFIMTKESFDQKVIEQSAKDFNGDFDTIFIDDKGHFIHEILEAKHNNYCIFLLVDIPFGYNSQSVEYYDSKLGQIKYRSGFLKIAKILRQKPLLITSHVDSSFKNIHYKFEKIDNKNQFLETLENIYSTEYLTLERFDEFKKMCKFENEHLDFSHEFTFENQLYKFFPATEKLYKVKV